MTADSGRLDVQQSRRRRRLLNAVKLAVSGAIFYYIFSRYIRYEDLLAALKYVRPDLFVYLLVLSLAGRYLSAYQIH